MEMDKNVAFRLKYEIRKIDGWNDYFVSQDGKVYSCRQKERAFLNGGLYEVSAKLLSNGYKSVGLYRRLNSGKIERKSIPVHTLVLLTFKPLDVKDGKYYECNHINGIKTDNTVDNLEWVSRSQNVSHSYKHLNRVKYIRAIWYNGIKYNSIVECCRELGLNQKSVNVALSRGQKKYRGKEIKYAGKARTAKTKPTNDYYV